MAGRLVHFEIPASDTGRAREFWGSLFGWQFQAYPEGSEYHMTRVSEDSGAQASQPRITRVETEPGGVVVHWEATAPSAASTEAAEPPRPFVVVGLQGQQGRVRFERAN